MSLPPITTFPLLRDVVRPLLPITIITTHYFTFPIAKPADAATYSLADLVMVH